MYICLFNIKWFCSRSISNNDVLWNDITSNNVNMQLANPEPRQVIGTPESSCISQTLPNRVMEKYPILFFSNSLENYKLVS